MGGTLDELEYYYIEQQGRRLDLKRSRCKLLDRIKTPIPSTNKVYMILMAVSVLKDFRDPSYFRGNSHARVRERSLGTQEECFIWI